MTLSPALCPTAGARFFGGGSSKGNEVVSVGAYSSTTVPGSLLQPLVVEVLANI